MKYLLNGNDIAGADYGRVIYNENKILVKDFPEPIVYNMVDLGEAGIWADRNVGAKAPEDAGLYFQWGDTKGYRADQVGNGKGKKEFSQEFTDYKFSGAGATYDSPQLTKYCDYKWDGQDYTFTDRLTTLELSDDAANVNMGNEWVMPTINDYSTLLRYTSKKYTKLNGVNGYKLTSITDSDKFIFLPCGDSLSNGAFSATVRGEGGGLWSSSLQQGKSACALSFFIDTITTSASYPRSYGFPVRGVIKK